MPRERTRLEAPVRRKQIISEATRLLTRDGYYRFSLSELATACGMTRPGVTHHIGTKESLMIEVLDVRDQLGFAAMRRALEQHPGDLRKALDVQVESNIEQPELVRLYTLLATEAMDARHPAHDYFQKRWTFSIETVVELLGRELPASHDIAVRTYAFLDGLQLNWLRDPKIDMWAHWTAFADACLEPLLDRRTS